eukprot:TRINITY_DN2420_c0_g1_i1.p1 TRINITY_DN2420_c0_g1~~TRINITY_DN2420_c0_g1_i1.p1  ORF type:complete len:472 (+),score=75.37 TRINITY_DN2420_c0_g1_i1:62-1477(+)
MNPVTQLFSLMPSSFSGYFTKGELLGLREVCGDLYREVTESLNNMREAANIKNVCRWEKSRMELAVTEWDPEPDARSSEEMIVVLKDLVWMQWPHSTDMKKCYEETASLLQNLLYQHASAIYGGSTGQSGKASPQLPCQPALQMYFAINCVTERALSPPRDSRFPPGIISCFKILYKSSMFTLSQAPLDFCGWDEVEYLLSATILGLKLPVPGEHFQFKYDALCDVHVEFLSPELTEQYTDMFDLFEYVASADLARPWQLDNFTQAMVYVSEYEVADPKFYGRVPDDILDLQRKVFFLYCHKLSGVPITDEYQHHTFKLGLTALIKRGRRDLLEILFTKWLPTTPPQPTMIKLFLGSKLHRRHLLYCMRTWTDGTIIASYFTEALVRRERCFVEFLWRFKNAAVCDLQDEEGNTPLLLIAGIRGRTENIVQFLIENGACPKVKNKAGQSMVDRALAIRNKKLAKVLLMYTK